jgi:hypothetical protein
MSTPPPSGRVTSGVAGRTEPRARPKRRVWLNAQRDCAAATSREGPTTILVKLIGLLSNVRDTAFP